MRLLLLSGLLVVAYSCSEINFDMPPGPDGKSAYEVWKQEIEKGTYPEWPKNKTDVTDFLVFIKGEKGDKGEDGKSAYELWRDLISKGDIANPHNPAETWSKDRNKETDFWDFLTGRDGVSPHIGDNGNWWIGSTDTGIVAKGKDGVDGKDGISPHIGINGNWWVGITDTGTPAKGQDGISPHIGDNGNWFIGSTDTKVPAKGQDGLDGRSAYEIWKEKAETGNLDDPKNPGAKWPKEKVEIEHFIQYLTGANGKDGTNGKAGMDGLTPYIGANGNWFIGITDTGVPAKGQDGADGKDGISPHIGANGNWFVGTTDTGVPAQGQNGLNGISPHIGDNGNWFIGTTDTGISAKGKDGINGQNGVDGKSAYELWIEDVKKGSITDPNTGKVWPADKITQADFWNYLKGKDGKDGVNGQSAYEIWKDLASTGTLDDPQYPTQKWPSDKIGETDFWLFLMGKDGADGKDGLDGVDGLSAFELWREEVAKGLNNPHKPGTEWPKDEVSMDDFWVYLSGKDGKDGIAGKPGEPGQTIEIVTGVPNVIAQYSQQEFGEYVRTSDGGVLYKVYDNVGQLAPGAIVKGFPGLSPDKTYTANANGEFIIPKEDLPKGKEINELVGKVEQVTYVKSTGTTVTEESAANTYVPNKIDVRLKRSANLYLSTTQTAIPLLVERNLNQPESTWEKIPTYLGGTKQKFHSFELRDKTVPTSFDETTPNHTSSNHDLTASTIYIYVKRHLIKPSYLKVLPTGYTEWDKKDHFYIVQMDSFYGEKPLSPVIFRSAPMQYVPMIKNFTAKGYSDILNAVAEITVEFDASELDPNLIYSTYSIDKTVEIDGVNYEYYEPTQLQNAQSAKIFQINFTYAHPTGEATANNNSNRGSFDNLVSTISNVHVMSQVYVSPSSSNYLHSNSGSVSNRPAKIIYDKETNKISFIGLKDATFNITDILDVTVE